jgi:cytochrome b6-f complex iron-sulfur subunit
MTERANQLQSPALGSTRREFLTWGLLLSLGALGWKIIDVVLQFSRPMALAGEYGGVFELGVLAELPTQSAAPLNNPEGKFFLVHTRDGLVALHKVCTHLDCLFDWNEQTGAFVCPCHGSIFAKDGTHEVGPASRSLDRFVIQLVDETGQVVAETDPETGVPLPIPAGYQATNSRDESGGDEDEDEGDSRPLDLQVLVDTGRKILGPPIV